MDTQKNERLLVVGGGGSRGAWGGGYAKYLVNTVFQQPYRYVFGTSTGSLMAPMIVLNDFETLEAAYTSVTQDDIFNVNPFKADGSLRGLLAAWRLLIGKKSFGESLPLKALIARWMTTEKYAGIIHAVPERQFTVCTVNFENGLAGYTASGTDRSYDEMLNWIWASANEPLFMTFTDRQYLPAGTFVDGGVRENIPVIAALNYAQTHNIFDIDIIVNKPRDPILDKKYLPGSILQNLRRLIELWETEVRNDDIIISILLSELGITKVPDITERELTREPVFRLNFHYIPVPLYAAHRNELIFDKEQMKQLWAEGEAGHKDPRTVALTVRPQQVTTYLEKVKKQ